MPKKRDMSEIFSTRRQSDKEPETQKPIKPETQNSGKVKNTWMVKPETAHALKRLKLQLLEETGKVVYEGDLIDEAVSLLLAKYA